jgi:Holliday junction resolvase RusA-like endonuclease
MIILELPKPPSSNHLYPTNRATGRRYRSREYELWLTNAAAFLWTTKITPIKGPVWITITVEDTGKVDLGNCEKSVTDFCVHHKLIEDDKRSIVRKITLQWGDVSGCLVEIGPMPAIITYSSSKRYTP